MEYCEDRRIRWTTWSNINAWFDNWERDLVELGFAFYDEDGKVVIRYVRARPKHLVGVVQHSEGENEEVRYGDATGPIRVGTTEDVGD